MCSSIAARKLLFSQESLEVKTYLLLPTYGSGIRNKQVTYHTDICVTEAIHVMSNLLRFLESHLWWVDLASN